MHNPIISVIVPCYNQAEYLDECLQSVLDQTFTDWECIIVNDGSPDNTQEVARKWTEKDARFQYFFKENGGVSSARNAGIKIATGEWILPLDADDKIRENYLKLAMDKLDDGYDLVYCDGSYFGDKIGEFSYGDYSLSELLRYNMLFVSAVFKLKKSETICFDVNLKTGFEDWEFWINYLKSNDKRVFKLQENLFYYRIKENSRNANIIGDPAETEAAKNYIYKKHSNLYHQFFGDYLTVLKNLRQVEHKTAFYKRAYNSKRYKTGNAIFSIYDKIISLISKPK